MSRLRTASADFAVGVGLCATRPELDLDLPDGFVARGKCDPVRSSCPGAVLRRAGQRLPIGGGGESAVGTGVCGMEAPAFEIESADFFRELVERVCDDEGGGAAGLGLLEQELHQRGAAFGVE